MAENKDPLEALLVDENTVAREELAKGLAPFLQLTNEGSVLPLPSFDDLDSKTKVLCALLGIKALAMLGRRESDRVSPAELIEMTNMAPGTVRPKLSKLAEERLITKADGAYWIGTHGARTALRRLGGEEDE
jgi:hypothetical protein